MDNFILLSLHPNIKAVMYINRNIDGYLISWADREEHKPVLLRGARQVGKSSAVRHLGEHFEIFVEINFEKQPVYKALFKTDLDVNRIVSQISAISGTEIIVGKTLLFLDEIQECPEAIMALRFFKEDMPMLHVVAAGSLLEFALRELPTFGVGRIHSMFMYPMNFDEFLLANGEQLLIKERNSASLHNPLSEPLHNKLVDLLRVYMIVGGMPESVKKWISTHDYLQCQEVQDDILITYEDDFPKYKTKIDPQLLRMVLRSVAMQATTKFSYSQVIGDYKTYDIKKAVELLSLAGIIIPVCRSEANGLPLGIGVDMSFRKMLLLDCGLLLRLLNMTLGDIRHISEHILISCASELVNKGPMAEQIAGTEMLSYKSPNLRHELFYWTRKAKNSQAEVDFVDVYDRQPLPIEIKAGVQGGMKSLWQFMREKKLTLAVRCSLEHLGMILYKDVNSGDMERKVVVCPLYAMATMRNLLEGVS